MKNLTIIATSWLLLLLVACQTADEQAISYPTTNKIDHTDTYSI